MSNIASNSSVYTTNLRRYTKSQILTDDFHRFLCKRMQRDFNQEPEKMTYKVTELIENTLTGLAIGEDEEEKCHVYYFYIEYNNMCAENLKAFLNSPTIYDTFEVAIPKGMTPQEYYRKKIDYFESLK